MSPTITRGKRLFGIVTSNHAPCCANCNGSVAGERPGVGSPVCQPSLEMVLPSWWCPAWLPRPTWATANPQALKFLGLSGAAIKGSQPCQ